MRAPKKRVKNKKRIKNRNNKQKRYYSGKKKRHTIKSQVIVAKKTKKVICTSFANGKKHNFRLLKESKVRVRPEVKILTDTAYQGLAKIHANSELPKKKSKKNPLSKADKKNNRKLSSESVVNENFIGSLKRFKIIADKYRNRRKRFGLRFNFIAGIHNLELDG